MVSPNLIVLIGSKGHFHFLCRCFQYNDMYIRKQLCIHSLLSWDHNRGESFRGTCTRHSMQEPQWLLLCTLLNAIYTTHPPTGHVQGSSSHSCPSSDDNGSHTLSASITNIFYAEGPCFQCERWGKLFGLCLKWRSWNLFKAAGYIPPTLCEIKSPWSDHFKGVTPDITP